MAAEAAQRNALAQLTFAEYTSDGSSMSRDTFNEVCDVFDIPPDQAGAWWTAAMGGASGGLTPQGFDSWCRDRFGVGDSGQIDGLVRLLTEGSPELEVEEVMQVRWPDCCCC